MIIIFIIPVIGVIGLVCYYAAEAHANKARIRRGEAPIMHHDLTDHQAPIDVIDWVQH